MEPAKQLWVTDIQFFEQSGESCTSASVRYGENEFRLWYSVSGCSLSRSADHLLAAVLIPAMKMGCSIKIDGSVSDTLDQGQRKIQEILGAWNPSFSRVGLEALSYQMNVKRPDRRTMAFFSGGVDSFYTVLKNRSSIDALVFVHGFDVPIHNTILSERVGRALREAASEIALPLIEVKTNLREFSDHLVYWGTHYHGSALASIALLLSSEYRTCYLPATMSYSHLEPWGSHPLLDALWRTESLEIIHDGCEATRVEKVKKISSCPAALRLLRVCWENRNDAYNCGVCEKCIRTLADLRAVGVEGECSSFDIGLDLSVLSTLNIRAFPAGSMIEETLAFVERCGSDAELAQALRDCLSCLPGREATDGSVAQSVRHLSDTNARLEEEVGQLSALVSAYRNGKAIRILDFLGRCLQRWS